jgi:5-methylcytosine-specific restriction protein A
MTFDTDRAMTHADEFRAELKARLEHGVERGAPFVEISSGDLHRAVGGYPGTNHRMPICCEVMYAEMAARDELVSAPPKGKGATLNIRYHLPR